MSGITLVFTPAEGPLALVGIGAAHTLHIGSRVPRPDKGGPMTDLSDSVPVPAEAATPVEEAISTSQARMSSPMVTVVHDRATTGRWQDARTLGHPATWT
jgi:hypothetical protein